MPITAGVIGGALKAAGVAALEVAAQGRRERLSMPKHHSIGGFSRVARQPAHWLGVILEIVLIALIDYTPWGNSIFGTAPISAQVWLFVMPFGIVLLALESCASGLSAGCCMMYCRNNFITAILTSTSLDEAR